jgi:acyl transferase domain-containing protein
VNPSIHSQPQQRVLLETVVDALDDAGYRPADEGGELGWNRDRIGMFAASAFTSYEQCVLHFVRSLPGTDSEEQ